MILSNKQEGFMKWISKTNFSLLIIAIGLLTTGCKKDATAADAIPTGPDAPATPGKVDNTGGFNIKVNPPDEANYYIHRKGDFDKKCVVTSSSAAFADRDIECVIETEELEAAFFGIDMVLNVPSNMCKFVLFTPSYYFGKRGGHGPIEVTINLDADGNFSSASYTPLANAGTVSFVEGKPVCEFNYTSSKGPNCCTGSYQLTTTKPSTPDNVTIEDWGGQVGACLTGAGVELVTRHPTLQWPVSQIYSATEGQSKSFVVGSKSVEFTNNSFWFANHYTSTVPTPFTAPPVPAPIPANYYEPSRYFEWRCLDDAEEQIARIRVQIREWNKSSEFDLGSAGNPDVPVGDEPDWTDPILDFNDFYDWDDHIADGNGYPGFEK